MTSLALASEVTPTLQLLGILMQKEVENQGSSTWMIPFVFIEGTKGARRSSSCVKRACLSLSWLLGVRRNPMGDQLLDGALDLSQLVGLENPEDGPGDMGWWASMWGYRIQGRVKPIGGPRGFGERFQQCGLVGSGVGCRVPGRG